VGGLFLQFIFAFVLEAVLVKCPVVRKKGCSKSVSFMIAWSPINLQVMAEREKTSLHTQKYPDKDNHGKQKNHILSFFKTAVLCEG
jgi:hypothetical protein